MSSSNLAVDALPDPGTRFVLGEQLAEGACAQVFEATDEDEGGRKVAVKVTALTQEHLNDIKEEYRILKELSYHPNLPDFYDVYRKRGTTPGEDQIWFVMELCEYGSVTDIVRALSVGNKRLQEEHIAYILKGTIKALIHLHEKNVMHRDVRGSNILLTKSGDIKLVDFALSRHLNTSQGKRSTQVGSPYWMAPEVVSCKKNGKETYDNRADVWSLGITAIELGDGKAPLEGMHPTRALFQIVRNPPPTLSRPANWSQQYNDFIQECLEKNPDYRPYIVEFLEHPFIKQIPDNDFHFGQEVIFKAEDAKENKVNYSTEGMIRNGLLKKSCHSQPERLYAEDLAALENLSEDLLLEQLEERMKHGEFHTFAGDILLVLNPNEEKPIYGEKFHSKYKFKSHSDNAPHIYAVADSAYQYVLHHNQQQHILLAGESYSGKTTNFLHLVNHLVYLGQGQTMKQIGEKILKSISIIHALGNASTPINHNSTRHILRLQMTFGQSGKVSGAIFWMHMLEKWRITDDERCQGNYHFLYYFYKALEASEQLEEYSLEKGKQYRFLRPVNGDNLYKDMNKALELMENLKELEFGTDELNTLWRLAAAILLLGEIKFSVNSSGEAELENTEVLKQVSSLLKTDEKKLAWSLTNYCLIKKGLAVRKRHDTKQAKEATDALARAIYFRLVEWVVYTINTKLSFTRAMFGDQHCITLLDYFGFESFRQNCLEHLLVNTTNEQMQYHYNKMIFAWEMEEYKDESIPVQKFQYYDNKNAVDALMGKPEGLLSAIDEATLNGEGINKISDCIKEGNRSYLKQINKTEFTVAHYTGKVSYSMMNLQHKNKEFLPPEVIETLRLSSDTTVRQMFTNKFTRTGNLTFGGGQNRKGRWGTALVGQKEPMRKYNTESHGEFSQSRKMRTAITTFRTASLELLRSLVAEPGTMHFVRCIRSDLAGEPCGFLKRMVRQQIRALAVLESTHARQIGYPYRISFEDFLKRYKFLGFDFNENVEINKENSRLLLVRLKMKGWNIGTHKVFLTYYNEEYLSRLYETQVKMIIKVQTMLRAFLAKRLLASKLHLARENTLTCDKDTESKVESAAEKPLLNPELAAIIIQSRIRGFVARKKYGPLIKTHGKDAGKLNEETAEFIQPFAKKWKAKSIFQVLLLYRSARQQDLVYFSQQVHLYSQHMMNSLQLCQQTISLDDVESDADISFLGKPQLCVRKIPFMLMDTIYFDTTALTEGRSTTTSLSDEETWDAPLKSRDLRLSINGTAQVRDCEVQTSPLHTRAREEETQMPEEKISKFIEDAFNRGLHVEEAEDAEGKGKDLPTKSCMTFSPDQKNNDYEKNRSLEISPSKNNKKDIPKHIQKQKDNQMPNPIHELELKFKKETNKGDDEPPFNFQAMLRKTNYRRDSLKYKEPTTFSYQLTKTSALNERNSTMPEAPPVMQMKPPKQENETEDVAPEDKDGFWEENFEDEVSLPRKKEFIPLYSTDSLDMSVGDDTKSCTEEVDKEFEDIFEEKADFEDLTDQTREIRYELAPGIVLEGMVADL